MSSQIYKNLAKNRDSLIDKYINEDMIYGLYQKDFDNGTLIIDKPGLYKIKENIIFNPNPSYYINEITGEVITSMTKDGKSLKDWMPDLSDPEQSKYNSPAFGLGFFAAISVITNNVIIDLGNHSLMQGKAHRVQQRFFSLIELANQPFQEGTGPFNFGDKLQEIHDVTIQNGYLMDSSHHGIHYNKAYNILIENVNFENFEVAAISINGGNNIAIKNVNIEKSNTDIPILGTYSAGRFIRRAVKSVIDNSENAEVKTKGKNLLENLETSMDKTIRQIITKGYTSDPLFRNQTGLSDGNVFGILIHRNFNVNGFMKEVKDGYLDNVYMDNVHISNIISEPLEVVGLTNNTGQAATNYGGAINDSFGSVIRITDITDENGIYINNVLSDVQFFVAKYGDEKTKFKSNIPKELIEWKDNKTNLRDVMNKNEYIKYVCGGDSMHHVMKGNFGLKCEGINNIYIKNSSIQNIENYGAVGLTLCGPYKKSHMNQTLETGYNGADTRGVSFSMCKNININNLKLNKLLSLNGYTYGTNYNFNTNIIKLNNIYISHINAGSKDISYTSDSPNSIPRSIGLYMDKSSSRIKINNYHDNKKTSYAPNGYEPYVAIH